MLSKEKSEELLFPHESVRKIQDKMLEDVDKCISLSKNIIIHAPTGLGKTASTLPVALAHALKKNLTVFFLTSRHTQHKIAVDTLKQIKSKYKKDLVVVDIIGKQWMCPVPGAELLNSHDFNEYCRQQREERTCEFYVNSRKKSGSENTKAKLAITKLKKIMPCHCEDMTKLCIDEKLCPYEVSGMLAKEANVVIADYYYVFHPTIRDNFLKKAGKELKDCIIIIDEAHNLPRRATELMTHKLSTFVLSAALKETKKYEDEKAEEYIRAIKEILLNLDNDISQNEDERLVKKDEFIEQINLIENYDDMIANLEFSAESIREKQKKSYIGLVVSFLEAWLGQDSAFARILSRKEGRRKPIIILSYKSLDPSLLTKDVVNNSYSTIMMSGTLSPTKMYAELLGFNENTVEKEFPSPFPEKNRMNIIIPETTTKFTMRSQEQYKKIAKHTADIVNSIPGNSIVFFPSYRLRDDINKFFQPVCTKTIFYEAPGLNKTEKEELLEKFKSYKDSGAVLLGVAAGSFSQGIDLPGDLLKAVLVVGLPFEKPNLETKEVINYYDKKFSKGWEYGYIFPAITKCLQSAGRCIRSETDKGVILFLDERFAWPMYKKYFPADMNLVVTKDYSKSIKEFF